MKTMKTMKTIVTMLFLFIAIASCTKETEIETLNTNTTGRQSNLDLSKMKLDIKIYKDLEFNLTNYSEFEKQHFITNQALIAYKKIDNAVTSIKKVISGYTVIRYDGTTLIIDGQKFREVNDTTFAKYENPMLLSGEGGWNCPDGSSFIASCQSESCVTDAITSVFSGGMSSGQTITVIVHRSMFGATVCASYN
jgi:hypothetical protein